MRIGFIGLGDIGGPAALHLIEAGHQVTVHRRHRQAASMYLEKGARWADSPAETARGCEAVFTALPFPQDVESVVLGPKGIIEGIPQGAVYGDLSTNRVSLTRRLYALLKQRGVDMLDMPINGGYVGSVRPGFSDVDAIMVIFVGGDEPVYRRLKPVIELMGRPVYCGPTGSGAITKIVGGLITHAFEEVALEAFTIGVKAGVPLKTLVEALSMGRLGKPYVPNLKFTSKYEGGARLEISFTSVRLACELGRELQVPAEISAIVEQRQLEALAKGWGHLCGRIIRKVYERRSGVELKGA